MVILKHLNNILAKIILFFIMCYQFLISPLLGSRCRFYPSCSHYSRECFLKFPLYLALWYSFQRLVKCHPFNPGGVDLVPDSTNTSPDLKD